MQIKISLFDLKKERKKKGIIKTTFHVNSPRDLAHFDCTLPLRLKWLVNRPISRILRIEGDLQFSWPRRVGIRLVRHLKRAQNETFFQSSDRARTALSIFLKIYLDKYGEESPSGNDRANLHSRLW